MNSNEKNAYDISTGLVDCQIKFYYMLVTLMTKLESRIHTGLAVEGFIP